MPASLTSIACTTIDHSRRSPARLPFSRLIALIAPRSARSRARFFPAAMPAALGRPAFHGERRLWQALRQAPLPAGAVIFCNRAPRTCRRRTDFLILWPDRGVVAIEVKGGRLSYRDGFRQPIPGKPWTKRIEPWLQSRRALTQLLAALDLNPLAVPHAAIVAMPGTRATALPFPSAPHMLTSEDLEPCRLVCKLEAPLPRLDPAAAAALAPALQNIAAALTRPGDRKPP